MSYLAALPSDSVTRMHTADSLSLIKQLAELHNRCLDAKRTIGWPENDVRKSFFGKMLTALQAYYFENASLVVANYYPAHNEGPDDASAHAFNFVRSMRADEKNVERLINMTNKWKLDFINGCWVSFESSIDAMFKQLIDSISRESMEFILFEKIRGLIQIPNVEMETRVRNKLRNKHISINAKWESIYKMVANDYTGGHSQWKNDRRLLEFFQTSRNCMHSNSVSAKSERFTLAFGTFEFREGDAIGFMLSTVVIQMFEYLWNIYGRIATALGDNHSIVDPAITQVFYSA